MDIYIDNHRYRFYLATMPIPIKTVQTADGLDPELCCVPLSSATLSEEEATDTATLFKALAEPNRVRSMNMLATCGEPVCVCEFVPTLGLTQPTVSFHLKKLADAGLLHREQRGTWAYYSINEEAMSKAREVLTI